MTLLRVEGISVFYGDLQALWDVSLTVEEGEIVSIVGANGAGKTTTLRTIAGFIKPARGDVVFEGERITGLPPHRVARMGISYVPAEREIFPNMTVMDNLLLGAYTNKSARSYEESLEAVFQIFPVLAERRRQLAGTMSGGEQQMLAIARGLMSSPRLLMLDEPSTGLAPKLVEELFRTIRRISEGGLTILLVEQNLKQALELADRAYVLETGRVKLHGTGEELLRNPLVKKAYLGL